MLYYPYKFAAMHLDGGIIPLTVLWILLASGISRLVITKIKIILKLKSSHLITAVMLSTLLLAWHPEIVNITMIEEGSLTVRILEERNKRSQGSEVWIGPLVSDGEAIPLNTLEDSGWEMINNSLFGRTPGAEVEILVPASVNTLGFVTHELSGIVEIIDGVSKKKIDLYSSEGGTFTYPITGNIDSPNFIEKAAVYLSAELLLFALLLTYIHFSPRSPERYLLKKLREVFPALLNKVKILPQQTGGLLPKLFTSQLVETIITLFTSIAAGYGTSVIQPLALQGRLLIPVITGSMVFLLQITLLCRSIQRGYQFSLYRIAIAAAGALLLLAALNPIAFPPYQELEVTIESARTDNAESGGTEVWISGITIGKREINLDLVKLSESGWKYHETQERVYTDESGSSLKLTLPGGNSVISLLQHPWSGKAVITIQGEATELDLYSETPQNIEFHVPSAASPLEEETYKKSQILPLMYLILLMMLYLLLSSVRYSPGTLGLLTLSIFLLMFPCDRYLVPVALYGVLAVLSFLCGFSAGSGFRRIREEKIFSYVLSKKGIVLILLLNFFITYAFFAEITFFRSGFLEFDLISFARHILFMGFLLPMEAALFLLFNTLSAAVVSAERAPAPSLKSQTITGVVVFILLTGIWSLLLYGFFPGKMDGSSLVRIQQALGTIPLNDSQPLYLTLLTRLLLSLWESPAAVIIFQILAMSGILTVILLYAYRRGISIGVIVRAALVISILPAQAVYVITLSKDLPFIVGIIWGTYLLFRYAEGPDFSRSISNHIQLFLSLLLIGLTCRDGLFILPVILIVLAVSSILRKKFLLLPTLILLAAVILLLRGPVFTGLKVEKANPFTLFREAAVVDLAEMRQEGYEMTARAENLLDRIAPEKEWASYLSQLNGNANLADLSKSIPDAISTGSILRIYISNFFRHPAGLLHTRLLNASRAWKIIKPFEGETIRFTAAETDRILLEELDEYRSFSPNQAALQSGLYRYFQKTANDLTLDALLWRPGISIAFSLIILLYWDYKKRYHLFFAAIPLLTAFILALMTLHSAELHSLNLLMLIPFILLLFTVTEGRGDAKRDLTILEQLMHNSVGRKPPSFFQPAASALLIALLFGWFLIHTTGVLDEIDEYSIIEFQSVPSAEQERSAELWITGISTDSAPLDLSTIDLPDNWHLRDGRIYTGTLNSPLVITSPASRLAVSLLKHQWSGTAQIKINGKRQVIDLYDEQSSIAVAEFSLNPMNLVYRHLFLKIVPLWLLISAGCYLLIRFFLLLPGLASLFALSAGGVLINAATLFHITGNTNFYAQIILLLSAAATIYLITTRKSEFLVYSERSTYLLTLLILTSTIQLTRTLISLDVFSCTNAAAFTITGLFAASLVIFILEQIPPLFFRGEFPPLFYKAPVEIQSKAEDHPVRKFRSRRVLFLQALLITLLLSIYPYHAVNQLTMYSQGFKAILLLAAVSMLFYVVIALQRFIFTEESLKRHIADLVAAIAAALLITVALPGVFHSVEPTAYPDHAVIELIEKTNPESSGREVWIQQITDNRMHPVELKEVSLPENWSYNSSSNRISSTTPEAKLFIPLDKLSGITFFAHRWSGNVKISYRNKAEILDLYRQTDTLITYQIDKSVIYGSARPAGLSMILSVLFFSTLIFVFKKLSRQNSFFLIPAMLIATMMLKSSPLIPWSGLFPYLVGLSALWLLTEIPAAYYHDAYGTLARKSVLFFISAVITGSLLFDLLGTTSSSLIPFANLEKGALFLVTSIWILPVVTAIYYLLEHISIQRRAYQQPAKYERLTEGILICSILLFIWSLYLVVFYPGIVPAQAADQFYQALGIRENNHIHPLVLTALLSPLIRIFENPLIIIFVQMILLALVSSRILLHLIKKGLPRWAAFTFAAATAALPPVALQTITMSNETFYAIGLLWISFKLARLSDTEEPFSSKPGSIAGLGLAITLTAISKPDGIIAMGFVVILLFIHAYRYKKINLVILFFILAILLTGIQLVSIVHIHESATPGTGNFTLFRDIAKINLLDPDSGKPAVANLRQTVSEEELETLSESYQTIEDYYSADSLSKSTILRINRYPKFSLIRDWLTLLYKAPGTFLHARILSLHQLLIVSDFNGIPAAGFTSSYALTKSRPINSHFHQFLERIFKESEESRFWNSLLWRTGLGFITLLIILSYGIMFRHTYLLFTVLPIVATLITTLFFRTWQNFENTFFLYLSMPLVLLFALYDKRQQDAYPSLMEDDK